MLVAIMMMTLLVIANLSLRLALPLVVRVWVVSRATTQRIISIFSIAIATIRRRIAEHRSITHRRPRRVRHRISYIALVGRRGRQPTRRTRTGMRLGWTGSRPGSRCSSLPRPRKQAPRLALQLLLRERGLLPQRRPRRRRRGLHHRRHGDGVVRCVVLWVIFCFFFVLGGG